MRKLAVITNIPTPYRVPLFRALAEALPRAGWQLEVVFGSRGNQRRLWKIDDESLRFPHHFLESKNLRIGRERIVNTYRGLGRLLDRVGPDAVLAAGYSAGTMAAARWTRRARVPLALWSGTVEAQRERSWWRRLQRRWLVRRSDAFLVYGTAARDYVVELGARPERVFLAWNSVDTDAFMRRPCPHAARGPLRLVTVGYLERRKRIDRVIDAVAAARRRGLEVELDVVGDGSERGGLESRADRLGVGGQVRFLGNRSHAEMPDRYAAAHLFAFPTSFDIWGLVLVEAMAAGLPSLASISAGATRDLVVEEETGFAVDFDDTEAVVDRIAHACAEPDRVARMGRAARDRIKERFSLERSVAGWLDLVASW